MIKSKNAPNSPSSRILKMELEEAGLSANAAALAFRIPANRVTEIINGRCSVSATSQGDDRSSAKLLFVT